MTAKQSTPLLALALLALSAFAPAAVAQDQRQQALGWNSDAGFWAKDAVRPLPSMNYDAEAASKWARFYTREDLEPVPYMDGSGSMVMRPRHPDFDHFGKGGKVGDPSGYAAIDRRDYLNRLAGDRPKMYLGDPGTNPFAMFEPDGSGQLGKKTTIGRPKQDWRGNPQTNTLGDRSAAITPRPGDFDYSTPNRLGVRDDTGMVMENTPGGNMGGQEIFRGDQPRYPGGAPDQTQQLGMGGGMGGGHHQQGGGHMGQPGSGFDSRGRPLAYGEQGNYPERYTVVPGDSLSGISDQERIYGDWKLWPLIYDANRNQINDPDLIFPGQNFGIPRDYNQAQEVDARRRALEKTAPYDFYDGR
jgi:hypothetical protein